MKAFVFLLLIAFSAIYAKGLSTDTTLNHHAKEIVFQQSVGEAVKPDFYHGKILVLDFWATWCAPCITGFPRFNELSKRYSDSGLVFASITSEPLAVVNKFFTRTKKELRAIKLIDTTKATMNAYDVLTPSLMKGIPYCIIIDKNNVVRWMGNTYNLNENIIHGIMYPAAVPINSAGVPRHGKPVNDKPVASRAFFTFSAARADTNNYGPEPSETYSTYPFGITDYSTRNNPLADVIERISGYSKSRFITNDDLKIKQLIDVNYKFGKDTSRFKTVGNSILKNSAINNFALSLLAEAFKFNARVINKKQKHYELVIADTAKLQSFKSLSPTHKGYDFDHYPQFEIIGFNLKTIAAYLESDAKIIITTRIDDNSRYDLSLDVSNMETLNRSLRFHGLKLKDVDDEVDMLNVIFY